VSEQRQFLKVVDADEARARWWAAATPQPLAPETVPLAQLRGRVLAEAVAAPRDVPGFDRSNVDGYAVQAADSYGASEAVPRRLTLRPELLACGVAPTLDLRPGEAVAIATGGVIPRGADAVVMVEDTEVEAGELLVRRPVAPGGMISFAGSDITRGEVVLRPGITLGARETGVLAAIGRAEARVHRRPRIAVLSTGDEIVAPGEPLAPGQIHDCNQTLLADACEELGAEALRLGIARDEGSALATALHEALHTRQCDLLLLSGGTSKGAGDLSYGAVAGLPGPAPGAPAICVHGVALKPGKPLCLAATAVGPRVVPIAVLPGFPTSALFTFHEFVAPLLRRLTGLPPAPDEALPARLAHDIHSERGRREYVLVQLLAPPDPDLSAKPPDLSPGTPDLSEKPSDLSEKPSALSAKPPDLSSGTPDLSEKPSDLSEKPPDLSPGTPDLSAKPPDLSAGLRSQLSSPVPTDRLPIALPIGKGSGSVTAFCRADGFIAVPRQQERLDAGERVLVERSGPGGRAPDLLVIGSHCIGLELIADRLHAAGLRVQLIAQGSQGGLAAAARGHCDIAPIHLLDPSSGVYNRDFVPGGCVLAPGYGRMQGLVTRQGDLRLHLVEGPGLSLPPEVLAPELRMVNRNRGSGTRLLIDELLAPLRPARPAGYTHEARSHAGVVTCVAQGRADWGVAIASAATPAGLRFVPIREERYDFVIPLARRARPAVQAFLAALADPGLRAELRAAGFAA
jgi:molybdenum cofactor synthesis domain-containing protein